jgi:hypothetical protein
MKKLKLASLSRRFKSRPKVLGAAIFGLAFAVVGVIFLINILAAGETLYISPETSTVQTGVDVTVTVRLNTGTSSINAIDATIGYDQTKLQYKSIDASASAFPVAAVSTGGNGTVNIVRGITGNSVTGTVEVAKVTFTAISTTSTSATLTMSGVAANNGQSIPLTLVGSTVSIVGSLSPRSASFTIEPSAAAPIVGTQFGLRVYATSSVPFQGGQVSVVLPTGLTYQGTLDTAGTAFNPVTTVTGTTGQQVNLVFVTQSTTMTGKQLVATIPVTASTAGAKSITFTGARLVDADNIDITPMTATAFSITANSASLPAPIVTIPGRTQLAATENITNLRQAFTITNFDSAATYAVTLGGQSLTVSGGGFTIPTSIRNGDLPLLIAVTRNGASGNASYTIRLRSPNVNRVACVELLDLLVVNRGYGAASTELDLNFDGTVSLVDLLTVTGNWGGACI